MGLLSSIVLNVVYCNDESDKEGHILRICFYFEGIDKVHSSSYRSDNLTVFMDTAT